MAGTEVHRLLFLTDVATTWLDGSALLLLHGHLPVRNVRVSGIVVAVTGSDFCLDDGTATCWVRGRADDSVHLGDRVEVVGHIAVGDGERAIVAIGLCVHRDPFHEIQRILETIEQHGLRVSSKSASSPAPVLHAGQARSNEKEEDGDDDDESDDDHEHPFSFVSQRVAAAGDPPMSQLSQCSLDMAAPLSALAREVDAYLASVPSGASEDELASHFSADSSEHLREAVTQVVDLARR